MGPLPAARPSAARRLTARLGRLRQLRGPADAVLFARVTAVAATVPLFVRLSLPRQAALLTPRTRRGRRSAGIQDTDRVVRCLDLAQDVARPLVRHGCLVRGVTLYWFLGRADDDIELCFGLGHPDASEEYAGHCWLTRAGHPYLEKVDPMASFDPIYRIPSTRLPGRGAGPPDPSTP